MSNVSQTYTGKPALDAQHAYKLGRAYIYGDGVEKSYSYGASLLASALIECATRVHEGQILAGDPKSKGVRLSMMSRVEPGKGLPDVLIHSITCTNCGCDQSPNQIVALQGLSYRSIYELIEQALVQSDSFSAHSSPLCKQCQGQCSFFVDFHAFQPNVDADLVIRCLNPFLGPQKNYQVLWLERDGSYRLATAQEVPSRENLTAQLVAQAAQLCLDKGDLEGCAGNLKLGMRLFPNAKDFLPLAHCLIDTHKIGVAEAIATQYVETYADDVNGYACLAQVFLKGYVNSSSTMPELLDAAEKFANRANSLGRSASSLLVKANCSRLRNVHPESVAPLYEALICQYPRYAAGYYNYALLWLNIAPNKALKLFQQGKKLAPEDLDFALGEARALIKLHRRSEARVILLEVQKKRGQDYALMKLIKQTEPGVQ